MAVEKLKGSGSGAGAEITALGESLQAYACAARQSLKKDLTDISQLKVSTVTAADCDRSLAQCIKNLDEAYYHTVITIANQMFRDYPFLNNGGYKFYRGKGIIIDKIYPAFNRLKKDSGIANANKWNPADIWVVKNNTKVDDNWKTLSQLNNFLFDSYKKGTIIGVSLKKLKVGGSAHKTVFNDGTKVSAKFTGFKTGTSMTSSKDVYIQFTSQGKAGEIQLRTFSSRPDPGAWQGEIKGKTAAGGKIGGGVLMKAAKDNGIADSALFKPSQALTIAKNPTDKTFKDFVKMWKVVSGTKEKDASLLSEAKAAAKKDETWWITKYLGVHYLYTLQEKKKTQQVTDWLFQYGSSATENSSVFVKYSD